MTELPDIENCGKKELPIDGGAVMPASLAILTSWGIHSDLWSDAGFGATQRPDLIDGEIDVVDLATRRMVGSGVWVGAPGTIFWAGRRSFRVR
jgi:hypothetical protein